MESYNSKERKRKKQINSSGHIKEHSITKSKKYIKILVIIKIV
jgi:hypothetical protein